MKLKIKIWYQYSKWHAVYILILLWKEIRDWLLVPTGILFNPLFVSSICFNPYLYLLINTIPKRLIIEDAKIVANKCGGRYTYTQFKGIREVTRWPICHFHQDLVSDRRKKYQTDGVLVRLECRWNLTGKE